MREQGIGWLNNYKDTYAPKKRNKDAVARQETTKKKFDIDILFWDDDEDGVEEVNVLGDVECDMSEVHD